MKAKIDEVRSILISKLKARGLSDEEAKTIAAEYLEGELRGRLSHGLSSFLRGITRVNDRTGVPELVEDGDCHALIDGKKGVGQLVGKFAMDLGIKKAKTR